MAERFEIEGLDCMYSLVERRDRIAYILYPMGMLSGWIDRASAFYDINIVVITGMDWIDAFSPWPAKGVPKGCPDFKGKSKDFLHHLQTEVLPEIESRTCMKTDVERSLVGVSMSGLFAVWQWLICNTFHNMVSLSGSFWYEGFVEWVKRQNIAYKSGLAYFLLGDREEHSKVKAFQSVGVDTQAIISLFRSHGIRTEFQSVPGNHYSDPIPRLNKAFSALTVCGSGSEG